VTVTQNTNCAALRWETHISLTFTAGNNVHSNKRTVT